MLPCRATAWITAILCLLHMQASPAQDAAALSGHDEHVMQIDRAGAVMGNNVGILPRDCQAISREHEFTIHAGRKYAADVPGTAFGMSRHELRVEPCSRISVRFVNEDQVRHQWMVHGLPKYLYPAGMFHLEAEGGHERRGTFIVPSDNKTYLIHCDLAQHMEKGMKGQLVVGRGDGDLWSVPGISSPFERAAYLPAGVGAGLAFAAIAGFLIVGLLRR
jgi:plastocyanin